MTGPVFFLPFLAQVLLYVMYAYGSISEIAKHSC